MGVSYKLIVFKYETKCEGLETFGSAITPNPKQVMGERARLPRFFFTSSTYYIGSEHGQAGLLVFTPSLSAWIRGSLVESLEIIYGCPPAHDDIMVRSWQHPCPCFVFSLLAYEFCMTLIRFLMYYPVEIYFFWHCVSMYRECIPSNTDVYIKIKCPEPTWCRDAVVPLSTQPIWGLGTLLSCSTCGSSAVSPLWKIDSLHDWYIVAYTFTSTFIDTDIYWCIYL